MSGAFLVAVLVLLALATVLVILLSVQCLLSLIPYRLRRTEGSSERPTIAILVPAHNEESVIGPTLELILSQLRPGDRLLVIADNCTDQTVSVASKAGAEVIERNDTSQRGKGFALAKGVSVLRESPPGIVMVVDADCMLAPDTVEALGNAVSFSGRPAQSLNLMDMPANPTLRDRVSAFAFLVKNLVRPLGCRHLRIPCLLRGTGMAFPWDVIRDAPLASGNIVEDLQLGIDLAIAGHAAVFCPEARVTSQLPSDAAAAGKQRRRWEHGHLQTISRTVLPTIRQALMRGRLDLFLLAIDVAIPPLSLLVLIWTVLGVALAVVWWKMGSIIPLVSWGGVTILLMLSIFVSWYRFGRKMVGVSTILAIPIYVLAKIPMYVSYLISPQREWVRTDRDAVSDSAPSPTASAVLPPK